MAINYAGFAQQGGGGGGSVRSAMSSIADAIPTGAQRREVIQSQFWQEKDMALPMFNYDAGELTTSQQGDTPYKAQTLTEAWNEYTSRLRGKGLRPGNEEWAQFKQIYDSKMALHGQDMLTKFQVMQQRGLKSPQIRHAIESNPGLRQQLIRLSAINPEVGNQIAPYLMGGKGIIPGLGERWKDIAMAPSMALMAKGYQGYGRAADAAGGAGKSRWMAGAKGALKQAIPGYGIRERSMAALGGPAFTNIGAAKASSVTDALTKGLTDTRRTPTRGYREPRLRHPIFKQAGMHSARLRSGVKGQRSAMETARKAYVKWKMKKSGWTKRKANRYWKTSGKDFKYRGKTYKGYQQFVGQKGKTKGTLDIAKKLVSENLTKKGSNKAILAYTKNFIEKHGYARLIKDVVKKAGWKTAAGLIGKTALSGIMKGASPWTAGISGAASLGLDAWTMYSLGKILLETTRDESGGVRGPMKMMFGAGKPTLDTESKMSF